MECAHGPYGRRDRKLRWHPDNAQCLCGTCHRYYTEHPVEWTGWLFSQKGEGLMEILKDRHNDNTIKYSKKDREEIYQHLKTELQKMRQQRANGRIGRIDFEAFD
jgi:hypothetical protein